MSNKKEKRKDNDNARKLEEVEYKEQRRPNGNSDEEFSDITVCFQKTREALEQGNKTLEFLLERTDDMKEYPQDFSKELSSAIKERKKALKNLHEICMKDPKLYPRLKEFMTAESHCEYIRYTMTQFVQHKQELISRVEDHLEKKLTSLLKRMKEVDEELERTRSAVHEKDEELESFKDRVAGDVASSIKTGKAINLNNPVSKPRIIELYEDLRRKWPKIKSSLKSKEEKLNSSKVRNLMETVFNEAKAEMKQKMKQIDDVFELNTPKSDAANSKVKEYRQLTIQNLQLAIYSKKQQDLKNPTPLHQFEPPDDVVDYLKRECFWLGRLMALNDPPLEPDWRSPSTTYDKWDLLPHSITECQKDQQKIESSRC